MWSEPALAGALLAVWTLFAPWLWGFDSDATAVGSHIAFGITFIPLGVLGVALAPAALLGVAGGVWLAVSPWLLGYTDLSFAAWANDLVVGVLLSLVSYAAFRSRRGAIPSPWG